MARRQEFGVSWWGQRWVAVLQSFGWAGRLQRGRTYARSGRVQEILLGAGLVKAQVRGSRPRPYHVYMRIDTLPNAAWKKAIKVMAGRADFAARLLAGEMPAEIEQAFVAADCHLLPFSPRELQAECSCPDWANPCKHIAAVHYVLAREFDQNPFLIFELRGRSREALLAALREQWAGGAAGAGAAARAAGAAAGAAVSTTGPAAEYAADSGAAAGGDDPEYWTLTAGEQQHFWDGGEEWDRRARLSPDAADARLEAVLKALVPPPFAQPDPDAYLQALREYYRVVAVRARSKAVRIRRRDKRLNRDGGVHESFEEMYRSQSRMLQRYIDSLLANRSSDFIGAVMSRAGSLLRSPAITFAQVKWRFETGLTDHDRRLIAAERKRRAEANRLKRKAETEKYYQEAREKEKSARLMVLEAMLLQSMGFTTRQIAEEMQTSTYLVRKSIYQGGRVKLNREIGYLCLVLEQF